MVEGYHHFPPRFLVTEYHINNSVGGSVWFGDSGGDRNCCIRIPERWRKGLVADVRWVVWDWSAVAESDFRELRVAKAKMEGIYRASVPVEQYDEADTLYVHFFPGGKVRVISSNYYPESGDSPIRRGDPIAAAKATQGIRTDAVFSEKEIKERDEKVAKFRKKYGDWR
jgi:hypothetical protein